jgi:hypothetical protein
VEKMIVNTQKEEEDEFVVLSRGNAGDSWK